MESNNAIYVIIPQALLFIKDCENEDLNNVFFCKKKIYINDKLNIDLTLEDFNFDDLEIKLGIASTDNKILFTIEEIKKIKSNPNLYKVIKS